MKGVVRDQHTGQSLVGATILILEQNTAVSTDSQGKYQITNLCPGHYTLECRIIGYAPFRQVIDLTEGHEENFLLQEQEIHLKDIEITAHRTDTPSSQPLTVISGTELFQTAGRHSPKA